LSAVQPAGLQPKQDKVNKFHTRKKEKKTIHFAWLFGLTIALALYDTLKMSLATTTKKSWTGIHITFNWYAKPSAPGKYSPKKTAFNFRCGFTSLFLQKKKKEKSH
jgi:glycopeptide antibiotics resistance protein